MNVFNQNLFIVLLSFGFLSRAAFAPISNMQLFLKQEKVMVDSADLNADSWIEDVKNRVEEAKNRVSKAVHVTKDESNLWGWQLSEFNQIEALGSGAMPPEVICEVGPLFKNAGNDERFFLALKEEKEDAYGPAPLVSTPHGTWVNRRVWSQLSKRERLKFAAQHAVFRSQKRVYINNAASFVGQGLVLSGGLWAANYATRRVALKSPGVNVVLVGVAALTTAHRVGLLQGLIGSKRKCYTKEGVLVLPPDEAAKIEEEGEALLKTLNLIEMEGD